MDEEEIDDDVEAQDNEDLVDEEAAAASDTDSLRTVSTVALSQGTTPAPSRPPSPVMVRIDSNGINAIPGLENYQSSRSRTPSTASTVSNQSMGVGIVGGGPVVDPNDPMYDLLHPDNQAAGAQNAGVVPPLQRTGSRLSGKLVLQFILNIISYFYDS